MLKGWWIYLLPLLYVPNVIGYEGVTTFGVLELMDLVIFPILAILFFVKSNDKTKIDLKPYKKLRAFILVCLLGLLIFPIKFNYPNYFPILLTASKIGKFGLYVFFGYVLFRKYRVEYFNKYLIALILIGVFLAYSSAFLKFEMDSIMAKLLFSGNNVTAVAMACLLSFLTPFALYTKELRSFTKVLLWSSYPLLLLGLLLSEGRAAIGAYFLSLVYLGLVKIASPKVWFGIASAIVLIGIMYTTQDNFKNNIDRTINPSDEYLRKHKMDEHGFDDGKRLSGISNEFPKYWKNPIIGTGYYHRGYKTDLMGMGSHNFYLQMLLETGIIGFIIFISFLKLIWKKAKKHKTNVIGLGVTMALVSLLISLLTGEYLYASEALMMLLLLIIPLFTIQENSYSNISIAII
jgi:hypothetical protein